MKKSDNYEFIWVPNNIGKTSQAIDVSSYGKKPYSLFNPFVHNSKYTIPVPGQEDIRSDSVEGIWQGLKIISSVTNDSLFQGRSKKRKGKPEGHLFGNEILGYLDARKQIYVPAYIYHVINNVLDDVAGDLEKRIQSKSVSMYDVESNGHINDLSCSYSHAALLVNILNLLRKSPLPPFNKTRFMDLQEQLDATLEFRDTLKKGDLDLCDDIITFAYLFSQDELKETFALRAIKQGQIYDKERLKKYTPSSKTKEIKKLIKS